jgi:D-alanyl-D-alanine-carboxypeptidase/D-alanyl-D-alanine-endopeptidase
VVPEDVKQEVRFRVDSGYNVAIVAGMVNGAGSAYYSYGATAVGNGLVPTEDTVFEIGSITKVFTTLLLADMAAGGKVSLDGTLADYLPSTALPRGRGRAINLEQLATHRAGLPRLPDNLDLSDPDRPYAGYTVRDLYSYLSRFLPSVEAEERYSYSNLDVGLLGHILERRTESSYEDLVAGRITTGLGMTETRVAATSEIRVRMARGHSGVAEVPNWENTTLAGSGRLLSTARDMFTFLDANTGLKDTPLLSSMLQTHEPRLPTGEQDVEIALGWHVRTVVDRQIVWHDGGTGGYASYVGFVRDGGTGVVVLSNTFESVNDIGLHLLAPDVPMNVMPAPAQIDSATLERYAGSYEFGQGGTLVWNCGMAI